MRLKLRCASTKRLPDDEHKQLAAGGHRNRARRFRTTSGEPGGRAAMIQEHSATI